jgi:hypothetical protein
MGISAYEAVKQKRMDDWQDLLQTFLDDPQTAANHMVMGFDLEMRTKARGASKGALPTWISLK